MADDPSVCDITDAVCYGGQFVFSFYSHSINTVFTECPLIIRVDICSGVQLDKEAEKSEAEVRYLLLTPLLQKVAHSSTPLSLPKEWGADLESVFYYSSVYFEVVTEARRNTPGAKPKVDHALTGYTADNSDILYEVPVEAKSIFEGMAHTHLSPLPQTGRGSARDVGHREGR